MKHNTYKELKRLLKKLEYWEQFKANLKTIAPKTIKQELKRLSYPPFILLSGAFQWDETPEGSNFWAKVQYKLYLIYKEKNNG